MLYKIVDLWAIIYERAKEKEKFEILKTEILLHISVSIIIYSA